MPATARDIRQHDQPALAVDLVIMTIEKGLILTLLQKREDAGRVGGSHGLPGSILQIDETLDQCVHRILRTKTGIDDAFFEQLRTFGALERDPRGRVVSVAYFALVPHEIFHRAVKSHHSLEAGVVQYLGLDDEGPAAAIRTLKDIPIRMAFDHGRIIATTIQRLRGKLDYSGVGFELLPAQFTLRDLQDIHETLLAETLSKPAFRKKMRDRGLVRPTGKRERGKAFRPAELYERVRGGG